MDFKQLSDIIISTNKTLYSGAVKAVSISLTVRNWLFGAYIVNYEQNGTDKAVYGTQLLKKLVEKVKINGISETNLKSYRQFYIQYPGISQTLSDQFTELQISQTLSDLLNENQLNEATLPRKNEKPILGALSQEWWKYRRVCCGILNIF